MKYNFELYDNTKTYFSPAGELFTPEVVSSQLPIVISGLPVVIETDASHTILGAWGLLSDYRNRFNIDDALSDEEAIVEIERIANIPPPAPESTAEERMAAALEFQNVLALPIE